MEPSPWLSLGLLVALSVEKAFSSLNLYDHVKSMHCAMSSCCSFDVERNASQPGQRIALEQGMRRSSSAMLDAPSIAVLTQNDDDSGNGQPYHNPIQSCGGSRAPG